MGPGFRRIGVVLVWLLTVAGVLPAIAHAAEPQPLRIGQRGFAELARDEAVVFPIEGLAGTTLTVTCTRWLGEDLEAALALTDPDGAPVSIFPTTRVVRGRTSWRVRNVVLQRSGTYRLTVAARFGTSGGFDLELSGRYPGAMRGSGLVQTPGGEGAAVFSAIGGDTASVLVRRSGGSSLKPALVRFEDAIGQTVLLTGRTKAKVRVTGSGGHAFVVAGLDGSSGPFSFTVRLTRPKASSQWRDLGEFLERGSIGGRIVVPGSAPVAELRSERAKRGARRPAAVRVGELVIDAPTVASPEELCAELASAARGHRFEVLASLTDRGPYLVRVASLGRSLPRRDEGRTRAFARAARRARGAAWVEANGIAGVTREPNDPRWPSQGGMRDMGLPAAWDITTGDPGVVIAVLDTGIAASHPDLAGRLVAGYDFVSDVASAGDGGGWDANPNDEARNYHGTHVAGTIGAATGNRSGVAGVVWNARIVPIRVLGAEGRGTSFDIAAGIRWAAGLPVSGAPANPNPARVLNLSLGGPASSQVQADAVQAALDAGAVVVAAAGNDATSTRFYPAAYPGVIAVAATAPDLVPASYSNFGSWISVSAPGGDQSRGLPGILSTYVDPFTLQPIWKEINGTSMASPHVAGVAALVLAVKPSVTPAQMKSLLETTAQDLGAVGFDQRFGHGLVDAARAVQTALGSAAPGAQVVVSPDVVRLPPGVSATPLVVRSVGAASVTLNGVSVTTKSGVQWLSAVTSGTSLPQSVEVRANRGSLGAGVHDGTVTLRLSSGNVAVPVRVVVKSPTDPGTVVVVAVRADGTVQGATTTTAAQGFTYTIPDLPLGDYTVVGYVDRDADLRISRVDEWYGRWPLESDPRAVAVSTDAMDVAGIDFSIRRYDSFFDFDGAGGGPVRGAVAVQVRDSSTKGPIPGARVHVGSGAMSDVTDDDGRAVLTGGLSGPQTVTVVADGYDALTTVACNAQYQSFSLSPSAPQTTDVTVTIYGLELFDDSVIVQAGSATQFLAYDGESETLVTTLTVPVGRTEIPVWIYVRDVFGLPAKFDLVLLDPATLGESVDVELFAFSPADEYWSLSDVVVRRPASGMDAATTRIFVTESLYLAESSGLLIGVNEIAHNTFSDVEWLSFGDADRFLAASIVASAFDAFGRESHMIVSDSVDALGFADWVQLAPPPVLTSPATGASGVSAAPTLSFAGMAGAELHFVEITDNATGARWTIVVPGDQSGVTVPALAADGLGSMRGYSWRVISYDVPGFLYDRYVDSALTTLLAGYSVSSSRTFTTR